MGLRRRIWVKARGERVLHNCDDSEMVVVYTVWLLHYRRRFIA